MISTTTTNYYYYYYYNYHHHYHDDDYIGWEFVRSQDIPVEGAPCLKLRIVSDNDDVVVVMIIERNNDDVIVVMIIESNNDDSGYDNDDVINSNNHEM